MGFSRQEFWSGLPFPSPGDLPDPGIELRFPVLQADYLPSEPPGKANPWVTREFQQSIKFGMGDIQESLKAPLSMEFSRQEYWSGLPFPSPEMVQVSRKISSSAKDERYRGEEIQFKGR